METERAIRLLQAQRATRREERPLGSLYSRLSSQASTPFSYKEINKVLSDVIEEDGSLGLVKALLVMGADVNFARRRNSGTWSKITQREHEAERNDLLLRATTKCRAEIVHALAARADQQNLDSVLHHAIVRGDLDVIRALLDHGASPVHLHEDFQDAVFHDDIELMKVLLSGHHLPCLACRSSGLKIAVNNRSVTAVSLLLNYWADVNYDSASALLNAVELSRTDLVTALISGSVSPSPRSLDAAVGKVLEVLMEHADDVHVERQSREILELCLEAGAAGDETVRLTTEGMVEAAKRGNIPLLESILRHQKSPDEFEAVALVEAIASENLNVINKLIEFDPSPSSLGIALTQSLSIPDPQLRFEVAQLLVNAGAQRDFAAEALVRVVKSLTTSDKTRRRSQADKDMDRKLFDLVLYDGNADVNHEEGLALQMAVRASCLDVAESILARQPSADSLGAALPSAMATADQAKRKQLVGMLLRDDINRTAAGKALVELVKNDATNTDLIELLLKRATVNYNNGEVFAHAIRNFHQETMHLLVSHNMEYKTLFTAVLEALKAPRPDRRIMFGELLAKMQADHLDAALKHVVLESNTDMSLAITLLESGAQATHDGGVCIKHAAASLNHDLLFVLAESSGPNEGIYTQALAGVTSRGRQWIAKDHVEIMEILLRNGACGEAVDKALVDVVDRLACQDAQIDLASILLNMLFAANADVNYENGKVVSLAAARGDKDLLARLLTQGATPANATLALSAAIMAHHHESLLLQLVNVFADQRSAKPDFDQSLPGMPPPLLLCLKAYGGSVPLLDGLVKAGCDLEITTPMQVSADGAKDMEDRMVGIGMEPVSVLMWAMLQKDGVVGAAVIEALIRHGADVSYVTPTSRTTPLILAVRAGRVDFARLLLEAGAKVSAKDSLGRSALFFASRAGHADLVQLISSYNPLINDGSLHEAARMFHARCATLLIAAGHDPNFRSTKHGGRTALGEIALNATVPGDLVDAEDTLDALAVAEASPLLKVSGKTVIFLALDNQENEPITQLLLDRFLYRTINSQENTYQEGVYHYSPTMYVTKGVLLGPQTPALVQILKNHGVEDRYYASIEEAQPVDAVGMPDEIREYERERRAYERRNHREEEQHVTGLRRQVEKAEVSIHIEDRQHDHDLRRREERAEHQRRQRELDHAQSMLLKVEKHQNDSVIRLSESNVDSAVRWQRHNDGQAMTAQKRDAAAAHRERLHQMAIQERIQMHQQRLLETSEKEKLQSEIRDARHVKALGYREDKHVQTLGHKDARHVQALGHRDAKQMQLLGHKEASHVQALGHRDAKQMQLLGHREVSHAQALTHKDAKHTQGLLQSQSTHRQRLLERGEKEDLERGIRDARHVQAQGHRDAKSAQALLQSQNAHRQRLLERMEKEKMEAGIREVKHVQSLGHMQNAHRQRLAERSANDAQRLEYDRARGEQQAQLGQRKNQLKREMLHDEDQLLRQRESREQANAFERHQMNMTELRTQRGNIIGKVNLEELRRWQQSQTVGVTIQAVPQTRLLAN